MKAISDTPESQIAYVDETGIDTYLYREYCYAQKGQEIIGYISGRKYRRVGIVAAKIGKTTIAPMYYDGTMESKLFEKWFENCLLPELPIGSTIVMDNASFHRKSKLILLAESYGYNLIFLPPYSPELNPIEKFWSWLKTKLRKILPAYTDFDSALCAIL